MISEYAPIVTARRAASLLEAVKVACYCDPLPIRQDRIHVANGTYFLNDGFTPDKVFCMNRLSVEYNADAPKPERWLQFLSELLHEEDIHPCRSIWAIFSYHPPERRRCLSSTADN